MANSIIITIRSGPHCLLQRVFHSHHKCAPPPSLRYTNRQLYMLISPRNAPISGCTYTGIENGREMGVGGGETPTYTAPIHAGRQSIYYRNKPSGTRGSKTLHRILALIFNYVLSAWASLSHSHSICVCCRRDDNIPTQHQQ